MKIIYVINARMPTEKAHGIHVMKICEALAKKCEVELVLPLRFNKIKQDPFEYYDVARNFKIKKIPCLDLIPLDKYLGHLALWVESLSFAFFAFFYFLFHRADVIYSRDKFLLFISLFWNNFVFEIHTFPRRYFIYSPFFKRLNVIVVITEKLKNLFIRQGIDPEKILVAPDGVDLEQFDVKRTKEDCRGQLGLPLDKKIILYTGHLYKWKGVDTLLKVAQDFQFPNALFVFVGGTKEDIKSFKEKAKNLDNVMIVGHKLYTEIPYWLKAADVLVLPNSGRQDISKHWTSPLKVFEYMASRRPIVASDLPSIREILNEENAILVEPDNPQALSSGILEALKNKQLSDKISSRAFEDVKQYSWDKRAEKICQKIF